MTHPTKAVWSAVVDKLRALAALPPNWDSYGAPTIDARIIDAAERFVLLLPDDAQPPRVVPLSSGSIQLEWFDGERILELEFESQEWMGYLTWGNNVAREGVFHISDTAKAASLIQWVTKGAIE